MTKKNEEPFDLLSERIRGDMLRGYSTALEGWRRGLNLQIKIDHTVEMNQVVEYILDDGIVSHHFKGSVGDHVSEEAVAICSDKSVMREHLQEANIKIPDEKLFDESATVEKIGEYIQKESYPLVIKSTDGSLVKHIHSDQDMKQSMEYLQNKMEGYKIIVEKHPKGENSQLYVVGGEVFHLTGQAVNEDARKLALEAVKSIPGLLQGSVIINIDEHSKEYSVIDINPHADIKKNESLSGDALRDVPKAIMDYYFPETKEYNREEAARLYFDFDHVYASSKRGKSGYMEIPKIPEDIGLTRFILMADRFPKSFLGWIQSTAVKHGVSGTARRLSDRKISLVLGGSREDINAFMILLRKKCRRFKYSVKLTRKKRVTPVMQGFNIIENSSLDPKKVKSLMKENKKLKKEIAVLKKNQPDTSKNNHRKFTRRLASVRKKSQ